MAIEAPPARGTGDNQAKVAVFQEPRVAVGETVEFCKAGHEWCPALVLAKTPSGLHVQPWVRNAIAPQYPSVLHADDPRQSDHRLRNNGAWRLPQHRIETDAKFDGLRDRLDQLQAELLKRTGKKGNASAGDV